MYIGKNVVFPVVQASLQLWVSDLYCFVHSLGHCYTYNPPADGLPSFEGGVGLYLGHSANLHHHQIYLHERGQFWPNENIPHLFRWKQEPNVLTKIFFQVVKYDKVSKKLKLVIRFCTIKSICYRSQTDPRATKTITSA